MKKFYISLNNNYNFYIIINIFFIGLFLRFYISQFGSNFDYQMWKMNLDLYKNGDSFYNAGRYNYGPVWINILLLLDKFDLSFLNLNDQFRIKIIFFLSFVDFLIFFIIYKKYNLSVGLLFFLNPISIFITGFHNQFDNLAILFGLTGIVLFKKNENFILKEKKNYLSLALIGLSLTTKHLLFFFPIWLAIGQSKIINKFLILFICYGVFLLSFFPYLKDFDGIIENVFLYKSYANGPFWNLITPRVVLMYFDKVYLFVFTLLIFGFILKEKKIDEKFFLYLIIIVIFSSGIFNQYLAIPLIAIAYFWNRFFLFYTVLVVILFIFDGDALAIQLFNFDWSLRMTRIWYHPILFLLFLGLLNVIIGEKKINLFVKNIFKKIFVSIINQFK